MGQLFSQTNDKGTKNPKKDYNKLTIFLLGTIDGKSALTKLRGQEVLLRMIYTSITILYRLLINGQSLVLMPCLI